MDNTYLNLALTSDDVRVLERALSIRLHNLRFELARTDNHDYGVDLRHQLDRLEIIENKIKELENQKKAA